ncbi:MAG: adenosylcobinamide-GDP ribazoletransferase [Candidatus Thiodiazotropha sp.]
MLRPLLIALQFLTVLPVRIDGALDAKETGRSLLYYPIVGLLIGALLAAALWVLGDAPPLITAAVLLAPWVAVTGALHLDGLADSADAWVGGHGDRDKTLTIMKDPRSGPMAVVALILVLLIKFAALVQILSNGAWELVVVAPVLGRTALVLLFLTTPYVRHQGLGSVLASHLPRRGCVLAIAFTLVAVVVFFESKAWWLLAVFAGVFIVLRRLMLRRIEGATGDTAGALVEITETVVLLTAALMY